jgi:hypothetical protein
MYNFATYLYAGHRTRAKFFNDFCARARGDIIIVGFNADVKRSEAAGAAS